MRRQTTSHIDEWAQLVDEDISEEFLPSDTSPGEGHTQRDADQ